MKKKYLTILLILIVTIMSACGPAPTPTLTAEEISNTAIADAWIAITQTQAAMPTATATVTPLPPTQTPLPTFTLAPTLAQVANTAVVNNSGVATQDPCNQPPNDKPQGTLVKAKFINKSGGKVNLSFGMNTPNSFGECVTYSYYLDKFDELVVTVLASCYWGYAWITGDVPSIARTGGDFICLNNTSKVQAIWVETEAIWLH